MTGDSADTVPTIIDGARRATAEGRREMTSPDPSFEALLAHLKEARAFDFTGYKRSSLVRRVDRRVNQVGAADYLEYLDYLQVHPDEFTALFNTILINVTGFFRDPDAWEFLRTESLPKLLSSRRTDAPIRIWSAGCASGEEAYTLAITLAELVGPQEFAERVKIYATDVDDEGLVQARQGAYGDRAVAGVPPELLERYFEKANNKFIFRKDLRRSVIFGRNDLVQDAPISRIDLLVCRNTLMYFNAETQARILARFHFALADHGLLFLGKAEMLLSHTWVVRADRPEAAGVPQGGPAADPERRLFHRDGGATGPGGGPRPGPPAQRDVQHQPGGADRGHRRRAGRAHQPSGREPVRGQLPGPRPAVPGS
jgi:chemotaxis methyl-accepting protein methylase